MVRATSVERLLKQRLGQSLTENVSLRDHSSLKVGGVADYFFVAQTTADLTRAISAALEAEIGYFILGGGSNVVFSDTGLPGLVIKNRARSVVVDESKAQVIADSGATWAQVLPQAASFGLGGMEAFMGLPGTIGGAIYGNAECFGLETASQLIDLTLIRPLTAQSLVQKKNFFRLVHLKSGALQFRYRSSSLKEDRAEMKPVILTARFQLSHARPDVILKRMKDYLSRRQALSQAKGLPSSGSFFKNPGGRRFGPSGLELEPEKTAGFLIDQSGLKGARLGQAEVSRDHANFIVNRGQASAEEIRLLADKVKSEVLAKFGLKLEEEVEYIGRW